MRVCERRAPLILFVGLAVAVAGAALFGRIQLDPQLEALLPPDAVRDGALAQARERYASDAPLLLIVQSSDAALNRRLTRELLTEVERWEETLWAIDRRDPSLFSERRLLFVDTETLTSLADDLEEIARWEQCKASPFCVNFEDRPDDPDPDALRDALLDQPEIRTLAGLFGADDLDALDSSDLRRAQEEVEGDAAADAEGPRVGDLCRPDGELCLVQAYLRGDPSDLTYAEDVAKHATALLERVRPRDAPEDLVLRIRGRFDRLARSRGEVSGDLARTGGLAILLVVFVLVFQFRWRAGALLFVPLLAGAGWTALLVALFAPPINIVSAATLIVMAGIGIDFGVHLVTHLGKDTSERSRTERVRHAFEELGPSLVMAAITTAACFGALATGRFAGFAQMGALCALAIVLTFVAFVTLFPPLALLLGAEKRLLRDISLPRPGPPARGLVAALAALGVVLIGLGVFALPRVEFEYDFSKLRAVSDEDGPREVAHQDALPGTTRSPSLAIADDPAALDRALDGLRERYPNGLLEDGRPWILTPRAFVPPDQEARLAAIARLKAAVEDLEPHLEGDAARDVARWKPYLEVTEPITTESLPGWVRNLLSERDGTFGTIAILFEGGSANDARDMERRADRLREWHELYPDVWFASQAALLGDIVRTLREDVPRVVGLAALALLLGTLFVGRSLKKTLLVAAPVVLAVAVAVTAMWLFTIEAHLYNVIIFPVALGVGVDGAIYVVFRLMRREGVAWSAYGITARAVLGSTLTTLVAFGALSISTNPGLASLGVLAIVTLGATLVANLLWLPALLRLGSATPTATATPTS